MSVWSSRCRRDRQDDLRSDLPLVCNLLPRDDHRKRLWRAILPRIGNGNIHRCVGFSYVTCKPHDSQLRKIRLEDDWPGRGDIMQLLIDRLVTPEARPIAL